MTAYMPLIGFVLTVVAALLILFVMSYLYWSDRYKTPEVIAAEVMQFSQLASKLVLVFAIATLVFIAIFSLTSLSLQLS